MSSRMKSSRWLGLCCWAVGSVLAAGANELHAQTEHPGAAKPVSAVEEPPAAPPGLGSPGFIWNLGHLSQGADTGSLPHEVGSGGGEAACCGHHARPGCLASRPAIPVPPPGASLHANWNVQAANALAEYFTIYWNEWCCGGQELCPSGHRHLGGILRRMAETPFQIKVEPVPDPALNEARRIALVQLLAGYGYPDADSRVIIAPSTAEGLRGDDIERVYQRYSTISTRGGGYGGISPFGGGSPFGGTQSFGSPFNVGWGR